MQIHWKMTAYLRQITQGYKGPSNDVWGAALTAMEMLLCGRLNDDEEISYINKIYTFGKSNYSKAYGDDDVSRLPEMWYSNVQTSCVPYHMTPQAIRCLLSSIRYFWDDGNFDVDLFCDLLTQMLAFNRSERLTMREAIDHPFFTENRAGLVRAHSKSPRAPVPHHSHTGSRKTKVAPRVVRNSSIVLLMDMADFLTKQIERGREIERGRGGGTGGRGGGDRNLGLSVSLSDEAREDDLHLVSRFKTAYNKHASKGRGKAKKGEITSKAKFSALLEDIGVIKSLKLTKENVVNLWSLLDFDGSGSISRLELFAGLVVLLAPLSPLRVRLHLLFVATDEDNSSTISPQEFCNLLGIFGYRDEEITTLFKKIDKNGDGEISLEEFLDGMELPTRR
jgi:Ca2+-binding EF-hand superfamily protein